MSEKEETTTTTDSTNNTIKNKDIQKIYQYYVDCGSESFKVIVLSEFYKFISIGQSVINCSTISSANAVYQHMKNDGHSVSFLNSDLSDEERYNRINDFRNGKSKVLISTIVFSKSFDIQQLSLVVNFDVPMDEEGKPDQSQYIQCIDRVGRFGRSCVVITLVFDPTSTKDLLAISNNIGRPPAKELKLSEFESFGNISKD